MPDSTYPYLKVPFHTHTENDGNWSDFQFVLDLAGIEVPAFDDDRGPEHFASDACFGSNQDRAEIFVSRKGSIGRAEVMAGCLLDAANILADVINSYKRQQLESTLAEIEKRDMSDPETRKEALAEAVHITKLLEELQKTVRRSLPMWEVKVPRRK